jgi:hypothetical protein
MRGVLIDPAPPSHEHSGRKICRSQAEQAAHPRQCQESHDAPGDGEDERPLHRIFVHAFSSVYAFHIPTAKRRTARCNPALLSSTGAFRSAPSRSATRVCHEGNSRPVLPSSPRDRQPTLGLPFHQRVQVRRMERWLVAVARSLRYLVIHTFHYSFLNHDVASFGRRTTKCAKFLTLTTQYANITCSIWREFHPSSLNDGRCFRTTKGGLG